MAFGPAWRGGLGDGLQAALWKWIVDDFWAILGGWPVGWPSGHPGVWTAEWLMEPQRGWPVDNKGLGL